MGWRGKLSGAEKRKGCGKWSRAERWKERGKFSGAEFVERRLGEGGSKEVGMALCEGSLERWCGITRNIGRIGEGVGRFCGGGKDWRIGVGCCENRGEGGVVWG